MKHTCSDWRLAAISASALSPFNKSFSLLYNNSSRVSVENSWFCAVFSSVSVESLDLLCQLTYSRQWRQRGTLLGRNHNRCTLSYQYLFSELAPDLRSEKQQKRRHTISGSPPRSIFTSLRFNGDSLRRADGFT